LKVYQHEEYLFLDGRFRPSPDVVAQRVGECVVLIHLKTNIIFELNRTGAVLWEHLSSGADCLELHARMLSEFDVQAQKLAAEVNAILGSLIQQGLVIAYEA
jgi:hypothetical protein